MEEGESRDRIFGEERRAEETEDMKSMEEVAAVKVC